MLAVIVMYVLNVRVCYECAGVKSCKTALEQFGYSDLNCLSQRFCVYTGCTFLPLPCRPVLCKWRKHVVTLQNNPLFQNGC